MVIAGGEHYRVGAHVNVERRYRRLADWADAHANLHRVTHRWSAHDMSTVDGVPYVGRYLPGTANLWVATGFGQWGMTGGTAAGHLLAARILGEQYGGALAAAFEVQLRIATASRVARSPANRRASPIPRWVRRGCTVTIAPGCNLGDLGAVAVVRSPAPERCSSDVPATGPPDDAAADLVRVHPRMRPPAGRAGRGSWPRSNRDVRSGSAAAGQGDNRRHGAFPVGGRRRDVEMGLRSRSPTRSPWTRRRASSAPAPCRRTRTAAGRFRCPPTGSAAARRPPAGRRSTPRTGWCARVPTGPCRSSATTCGAPRRSGPSTPSRSPARDPGRGDPQRHRQRVGVVERTAADHRTLQRQFRRPGVRRGAAGGGAAAEHRDAHFGGTGPGRG